MTQHAIKNQNERTIRQPILNIDTQVRSASVNDKDHTFQIVWTTGARRRIKNWYAEEFDEELDLSPNAIRLDRMKSGSVPLLKDHKSHSIDNVIGNILPNSTRIENGRGIATVRFSTADQDQAIWEKIKSGVVRNVSVGYRVHKYQIEQREGEVELWRGVDWEPYEISMVAIGADENAQVRHASVHEERTFPTKLVQGSNEMIKTKEREQKSQVSKTREQINEFIRTCADRFAISQEFADDLIARELSEEAVREELMNEAARRTNTDVGVNQIVDPCGDFSIENPKVRARAMALATFERMAQKRRPEPEAEIYRGFDLVEMARDDLSRRGFAVRGMGRDRVIRTAIENRSAGYGAMGTGDFVAAIGDAGRMTFLDRYQQSPPILRSVATQMGFTDYRPHKSVRGSAFPELKPVNEHGEITNGTMADSGEEIRLTRSARKVALTHQLLVNDAVGIFADLMNNAAEAAIALEANVLAKAVEDNPVLADGKALFHPDHNNLAGSGGAPDESTLGALRSAMRKQIGLNGERIAPTPKFLIVHPDLETPAEKLVSLIQAAKTDDANVFSNLIVLVEPRFDDPAAWYLAADPAQVEGLRFGYLDGEDGPIIDERAGWEVDGIEVRVRFSFAAGFVDYRGWQKNPGASG